MDVLNFEETFVITLQHFISNTQIIFQTKNAKEQANEY